MAGQRKSVLLRVNFNGEPFMNEVINYKSSRPKKKMESVKGGTYVEGSTSVGIEAMKASVTIKGATTSVLRNYGLHNGNKLPVTRLARTSASFIDCGRRSASLYSAAAVLPG